MQFFPDYGYGLHRLVYVSRSCMGSLADPDQALTELILRSAARNRARAVTGMLLASDGWFIQALEGSREAVKPLYDLIAGDPRHAEVTLRAVDPAERRMFSRWGMKQGRAPMTGLGFDIATASGEDLLALLKLSSLNAAARAA